MSAPASLTLLATLTPPTSSGSRAWQSAPHPSPSTPLLATASADRSIQVYSLRDFSLVSTISGGHKRSVRCVEWKDFGGTTQTSSANGDADDGARTQVVLGTGSFDANVGIWIWNDAKRRATFGSAGAAPAVDKDTLEMDVQDDDDEADEEWAFSTLLTGPDSEIKSIAFSPPHYGANLLATSSRDKSVWVWEEVEPEEWETIAVLGEHTGDVKCVSWCAGARRRKRRRLEAPGDVEMGNGEDDERDDSFVGSRELLASGSYDDTIRLWRDVEDEGDWMCVGVLEGHAGTVWDVKFEPYINYTALPTSRQGDAEAVRTFENNWEPRLLSCSDDLTVRVWRRELSEAEKAQRAEAEARAKNEATTGFVGRVPSSIRTQSSMERWTEEARLPEVHVRSIYAVDWSRETGMVVSCGGDGAIAVYKEVAAETAEDAVMNGASSDEDTATKPTQMRWEVMVQMDAAHEEFEINHVCWATRRDKGARWEGEQVIVSTGDEGSVRVWELPDTLRPT